MRINNINPYQEKQRNIKRTLSHKGISPEKVVSLLSNPDSLARTVSLETFVTGGRSANAYKRGGFPEFRETFTDNLISAIFWMKGVDIFNRIGNWIGKNILNLPTTEFDVGKDALRTPFKNIAAEVSQGMTPEAAKALENKLAKFKFSKIIISSLLATGFVGFALPKINQAITRSMMNKQLQKTFKEDDSKPYSKSMKQDITMENFEQQISKTKSQQTSFKGISPVTLTTTAHLLENNPIVKMLTCDVGILSGRMITARNPDEGREYLFRDTVSSFFYMASTPLIYLGLQKLTKSSALTDIDAVSAKGLNEYLINIIKENGNTSMPVEEFAKKTMGSLSDSSKELLSQLKFNPNITMLDRIKQLLGIAKERSTKGDVISLNKLLEVLKDEELVNRAKEMAKLQPEQAGVGGVLTKQQVKDILTGGKINNPKFLFKNYKSKFGETLTNPHKYISSNKITKFKDNIENYTEYIIKEAKKNGGVVDEKLLNSVRKKSFIMSTGFIGVALGISAIMLGVVIPKMQFALTAKRTGVYAAPGLREFEKAKQE